MREDILEKLADAGFKDIKYYGDFTFDKPSEESQRIFFVCKK